MLSVDISIYWPYSSWVTEQLSLSLREKKKKGSWGGKRKGAGRKRSRKAGVLHRSRPSLSRDHPVHATLRLVRDLPSLRVKKAYRAIKKAMSGGSSRFGFRLVHYSVQKNHMHMIVEASDRVALS